MIICQIEDKPMDENEWCKKCPEYIPDDDGICVWATRVNPERATNNKKVSTNVNPIFAEILKPFAPKEKK